MKATEFAYWLQGMFELSEPTYLTERQTDLIRRHLAMVFIHDIDPSYPKAQQAALDAAHAGEEDEYDDPANRADAIGAELDRYNRQYPMMKC